MDNQHVAVGACLYFRLAYTEIAVVYSGVIFPLPERYNLNVVVIAVLDAL